MFFACDISAGTMMVAAAFAAIVGGQLFFIVPAWAAGVGPGVVGVNW